MKKILLLILLMPGICISQVRLPLATQTPPKGTSHSEMVQFLSDICTESELYDLEFVGASSGGHKIPAVFYPKRSVWKKDQTRVFVFAQQHGNEPSGKEALLMMLHELYLHPQISDYANLNLILVPMVNPDGNEADKRRNGNDYDLNRNHVILSEPETRLLHKLFEQYQPHVTLDVHEYGSGTWLEHGYIKDFGEQLDCVSNPAIPSTLKNFAIREILDPTIEQTRARGVKANRYLITRGDMGHFVRHSTTDINDGRNGFGIRYSLSFILEGLNAYPKEEKIWQRGKYQLTLIDTFLKLCNEKSQNIYTLVENIRNEYASNVPDSVIIQADYTERYSRPLEVTLIRTTDFRDTTLTLPHYRPEPEAVVTVKRPVAYIVKRPDQKIIAMLESHHIAYNVLTESETYNVEQFEISGRDTLRLEGRDTIIPGGRFIRAEVTFTPGDIIITTSSIRANQIVQILEPQSFYGISYYKEYQSLLDSDIYPVFRIISKN